MRAWTGFERHRSSGAAGTSSKQIYTFRSTSVLRRGRSSRQKRLWPSSCAGDASAFHAIPAHFDLEKAVLLASCAFESYDSPVGGLDEEDGYGNHVHYASSFVTKFFSGILKVTVVRARDLPKADLFGSCDPYVYCRVGMGARRTRVQKNTFEPVWNETCYLFVKDVREQFLRLSVFDEDVLKSDDCLGEAQIPLTEFAATMDDEPLSLNLEVELQNFGRGFGKGYLEVEIAYFPFQQSESIYELFDASVGLESDHESETRFDLSTEKSQGVRRQIDRAKKEWESKLWKFKPENNWNLLAIDSSSRPTCTPLDYEKIAYVSSDRTDTQATVWRNIRENIIVVAFRGTETTSLRDLVTDAKLLPCNFSVERVKTLYPWRMQSEEPAVHSGFLEAFDSIRATLMHLVEAMMEHPVRDLDEDNMWHIYLTGHSLGGALSTLMAAALSEYMHGWSKRPAISMYNFGSPRVGNEAFVQAYNDSVPDSFRLVNEADAIPHVPLLLGYKHVDHAVYVTGEGKVQGVAGSPRMTLPSDSFMAAAARLGGGELEDIAGALEALSGSEALEAHMEDYYFESLRKVLGTRLRP